MKLKIYCVYDKIADDVMLLGTASTDGAFIRQNKGMFEKLNPNYFFDFEIWHVADMNTSDMAVIPCEHELVDYGAYSVPEIPSSSEPAK